MSNPYRPPRYTIRLEIETPNGRRQMVQGEVCAELFEEREFDPTLDELIAALKYKMYDHMGLRRKDGHVVDYLKAERDGVKWR